MSIPIPSSKRSNNSLAVISSYSRSQTFRYDSAVESAMASRAHLSDTPLPKREPTFLWDHDPEVGLDLTDPPGGVYSRSTSQVGLHNEQSPLLDNINKSPFVTEAPGNQLLVTRDDVPLHKSSSSLMVPRPSYGSFRQEQLPAHSPHPQASHGNSGALGRRSSFPSTHLSGTLQTLATPAQEIDAKTPNGSSTYGQTLFNSIAVLVGVGILSEPLAFASAGWGLGTVLIIFYGALSCYTSKILGRIILSDRSLQTYADIGRKAFGPRANLLTSFFFCLELFFVSCVFVTLAADSTNSMFPVFSSNTYKLVGLFILFPTMFIPLRLISYASAVGIISTIFLIFVVFFDGFSKDSTPGSLYDPAPTDWVILEPMKIGAAFGLFMSGFAGHAVIPNLAKDMAEPHLFDHMVDRAFFVATLLYALIGAAGYMMFGRNVSDEISLDLLRTPGYNRFINQIAIWMLVISPLTKFPLTTRPLTITLEIMLGLNKPPSNKTPEMQQVDTILQDDETPSNHLSTDPLLKDKAHRQRIFPHFHSFLCGINRLVVASLVVAVSILVPQFSSLMSFLGAFSAFTICIIGPLVAKMALEKKCELFDSLLLGVIVVMTVWGTYVACTSSVSGL